MPINDRKIDHLFYLPQMPTDFMSKLFRYTIKKLTKYEKYREKNERRQRGKERIDMPN